MCRAPIRIRNPNYNLHAISQYNKSNRNINLYLKNTSDRFIDIPCGKCPDCIHLRQQYIVQRTICESFDNDLYFCTLTYKNSCLPHVNINGYNIAYADIKHVQNMMKRIRKNYNLPDFRYFCVSEFGKSTNRPHFHLLLSFPKVGNDNQLYLKLSREQELHSIFLKEWRINKGSTRKPDYVSLCDYKCTSKGRNFDLHYVNPSLSNEGVSNVAFYVSKYMLKVNPYVDALKSAIFYNTPDTDTFKELWSIVRPRIIMSKHYGNPDSDLVKKHIRYCIDFSIQSQSEYPLFVNPIFPNTSPLCPYYRRKFVSLKDAFAFYYMSESPYIDNTDLPEDYDPVDFDKKVQKFEKTLKMASNRDAYYDSSEMDYDNDFVLFTQDYINVPIQFNKLNSFDYESEFL